MQMSVPEAMDITKEPEYICEMYGAEPGKASFANNCLLARRLMKEMYALCSSMIGAGTVTELQNILTYTMYLLTNAEM